MRLDREPEAETRISSHAANSFLPRANMLRASDALLVSDYGYGAATPESLNVIREKRADSVSRDARLPPSHAGVFRRHGRDAERV